MHFIVLSINREGRRGFDFIKATNEVVLMKTLDRNMALPLKIVQLPTSISWILPSFKTKVSPDEVIEIIESLYLITKSGLPLYQGILDLTEDSDNKAFNNMLFEIADNINRGKPLSEAFEEYKNVVSVMILNLIKIGEETGQLEFALKRAASFLRRINDLKKRAKSALIYPAFAFFAITVAMLVWMVYVLPQMTELFKEMSIELPFMTVVVMNISNFLSSYIVHLIVAMIIFIILFKFSYKKYQKLRMYIDKLMLSIPVIKNVISSFNTAFISEYLKLALISGIPIIRAMNTLNKNIKNELYQKALKDATKDVEKGTQLSSAFLKTKMFSSFTTRMISVGESAGTLDAQFDIISSHYYAKVDYFADNIGKIIEPVVLIIVGGFMAVVMISLMGPMYDLISSVK
ncbi:MAG TPA: type II secretion system F family protein [Sulfurimonas sp.]|uniref:type II secretion system F family protein n=1 Tax=Sulfurimonas sp. TaxID=2022749 RepID=UPI002CBEC284|nr:type II secretion system F family protein [Sulfurimonas sp.]HUH42203.1 type II secretion system F family protein [Sulfurimonas sp.]